MDYRVLGKTGLRVSALSLGASPFGGVFGAVDQRQCGECLHAALDAGLNYLDTSPFYGQFKSESMLGQCLQGVPRERYFLATKVGRYLGEAKAFDFSAARVRRSIDESLARLKVSHVDIIQCHDIEFAPLAQIISETIPALREMVRAGKARFVGITGLPLKIFREVLAQTEVDTVLSYCHYTLNDTSLTELLPLLEEKNVGIINASPFSMGLLTKHGPPEWHPAPENLRETCRHAIKFCEERGENLSRVAMQFALENKRIHTTLVGTASAAQIRDSLRWLSDPLPPDFMAEVRALFRPIHNLTWPSGLAENN
jgi:L-galactose dehydrogenase